MEGRPPNLPPAAGARSKVVVPEPLKWHGKLAAWLIWALINTLASTLRWRFDDRSGLCWAGGTDRAIFVFWPNRLALSFNLYRRHVAKPTTGRRVAALISASRDGGLLARVMGLSGVVPARGSSSRRGAAALRELVSAAKAGCDLAITPDGPRGPCYQVQEGVILAAQLTGLPIVPLSYRLGWKLTLRSWDHFHVPLPFSRVEVMLGAPIGVPRDTDEAGRARLREELQVRLMAITHD